MKKLQGYILYIDILGYKNLLINNNEQGKERIKNLLEQFTNIYINLDFALNFGENYAKSKLFRRFFSDNFLFAYESEKEEFCNLNIMQGIASQIQYQFLCCGILTRGSLIYGEIEYSNDIVFGCDLIKSVELENHPEPSVLIDEDLIDVFANNKIEYHKHNSLFYVHGNSELDRQDVVVGIEKYLTNFNKQLPDKKIYEKINWVVDRMNEHFKETKNRCRLQFDFSIKLINEIDEKAL